MSEGARPTRARHWVVFFAVTLALICYTDRVIIAQAAPEMRRELGLSAVEWGWVLGAFSIAYAVFEIPGGWMGDRWGARKALLRVVTFWSLFTAATGWVRGYASLLACRFLFGAGEAGCFPNLAKTFTVWLPQRERMRAQGWMWLAARWGGAVTPLLVALLLQVVPWRRVFELFGLLGIVWAVFFWRWYRDDPRQHPSVDEGERALLPDVRDHAAPGEGIPWGRILGSRSVRLLWLQYFLLSYGWWFYIQWLPTYLREARGFVLQKDVLVGAVLAGLPLFLGGVGSWLSGLLAPAIARRVGGQARARRLLGAGGLAGAGVLVLISIQMQDPLAAMIVMGLAGFANDVTLPCSWAACMDLGGRFTGTLSGAMNMAGALGGAVAGPMVGYLLFWSGNDWNVPLYAAAAAYLAAAVCWAGIDPVTPLEPVGRRV